MKPIEVNERGVVFQLNAREHEILLHLLQSYPAVPAAGHGELKPTEDAKLIESRRLLDEALAEQRAASKLRLRKWLDVPGRFEQVKSAYRFTLEREDDEWLLQVLNDIRVGSWMRLGSPELEDLSPHSLNETQLPDWVAMEMSGYFQSILLHALND